ncbi:putative S-layer protein [Thermobacillus composti KWC4]|uniref:Putative S-layer protein n=1 Tax=Thermobacillus composti (strain DSM 18247 / JCM 13945 / KWC4) TaxID=717605 RepID=L0EAT0_THECK|nr:S-layer homology domain-containing protein [Thermobacillus composti]AGA56897.1 putative S-layer protein [Thermobacillus composti KWC4]
MTTIDANGKVAIGPGGATVSFESGLSLDIREGAELVLDEESALGLTVVSGNPFRDVDGNAWFYDYVNAAYTFSLFDGTSSTSFSPGVPMTRAMFIQVLANLENVDRSGYSNTRFRDVAVGKWYTAAVGWASENGIVNGTNADRFDPDAPITREQMIVILYKYLQYKGIEIPQSQDRSFADESKISPWALEAAKALQGIDIVTGKGGNLFDPKGTATRAEAAAVFVRLIEYLAKI